MSRKIQMGIGVLVASSGRPVPIEWAMAIATLAYPVGANHCWLISKADPNNPDMTRDIQRETLVERAIALGTEFAMFFDDDTVPPTHAIQSLWYVMCQNPKAAIVGGIYVTKSERPEAIVYKEIGGGAFWNWTLGDIFPCKGLGLGCMMIRLSALKNIPKPWFKDRLGNTDMRKEMIGEVEVDVVADQGTDDLYLCAKVADAGYEILAHGGVLPLHVGEDGQQYQMPDDSYPVVSYLKRKAEYEVAGKGDVTNLKARKVTTSQDLQSDLGFTNKKVSEVAVKS